MRLVGFGCLPMAKFLIRTEASAHPAVINRKGIVFHRENDRPQTWKGTRQKLSELGLVILKHALYRLGFSPSDNQLFVPTEKPVNINCPSFSAEGFIRTKYFRLNFKFPSKEKEKLPTK